MKETLKLKKYGRYMLLRLYRMRGTPHSIAAGLACGVAISFTPFVGMHFVLAGTVAFLLRANVLASAIGTVAGNPWTFPFIWIATLYTGRRILGGTYLNVTDIDFFHFFQNAMRALMTFDFSAFIHDVWPILWPMIIGSIPFYVVAWGVTYYFSKRALIKIGERRLHKIIERADN